MRNINRVQKIANRLDIHLRPHIKTHKSPEIFAFQQQAGAVGITASKIPEAMPFIEHGVQSVKLVYPIVDKDKIVQFFNWLKEKELIVELIFCLDSKKSLTALVEAQAISSYDVSAQIIVDIGYERCGIPPSSSTIFNIIEKINHHEHINFYGLITHNGLTYGAKSKKHIGKLNYAEFKQLLDLKKRLERAGFVVSNISTGSTPGVLGDTSSLSGTDEIRPGNYVFMDRTPYEMGLIKKKQVALTVLSQIISENNKYYIIDAGKKVMSSDQRKGSNDYGLVYPWDKFGKRKKELKLVRLSEEHGFVKKEKHTKYKIGDKVRILPNHSCVVANLGQEYCVFENDEYKQTIPILAAKTSHAKN